MSNKRVVVLGTSGSGKTTLAQQLAAQFGIKHIELDVLYWNPQWVPKAMPEFLLKIKQVVAENDNWVICGNYNAAKKITLPNATHIIWLDFPLHINLWRAFKRSAIRIAKRQEPFIGCRETVSRLLFSKESILLWILQTHSRRRREFSQLLTNENFPKANIYRIRRNDDLHKPFSAI